MKRFILWIVAGIYLYGSPAFASEATELCDDTNWTAVDGTDATADSTTSPINYTVRKGGCLVYRFTTTEDSDLITLQAPITIVTFDPAIDSDGADAAQVYIRRCEGGNQTLAVNTCSAVETELGTSIFTGAAGLKSIVLPRGSYYVDNAVSAGGDTATVTFDAR